MEDEQQFIEDLQRLQAERAGLRLELDPVQAAMLVGCLQLAWKHPGMPPNARNLCDSVGHWIQGRLARYSPATGRILEKGWQLDLSLPSSLDVPGAVGGLPPAGFAGKLPGDPGPGG